MLALVGIAWLALNLLLGYSQRTGEILFRQLNAAVVPCLFGRRMRRKKATI